MGWRGIIGGALALIFLQLAVQPRAARYLGDLAEWPAKIATRFLDPDVPAIPRRGEGAKTTPTRAAGPTGGGGANALYPEPARRTV